jgi:hypothetical protein
MSLASDRDQIMDRREGHAEGGVLGKTRDCAAHGGRVTLRFS